MRRGTPSAELFGGLLTMVRKAGTGRSMRWIAEKMEAPAATVSQIEKGQRALKEPKIAMWAAALEVSEADLHELWLLSQGQIQLDDERVFYTDRPDVLGDEPLEDDVALALQERRDLEPIYRLAERIADLLRRLLPDARLRVEPDPNNEPPFVNELLEGTLTGSQEYENEQWAETFPLPIIHCRWGSPPDRERRSEFEGELVRVPLLQKLTPIVRRRGKSVKAVDLEDLIHGLSGPERERVRGYIDAVVEQRANPKD